MIADNANDTFYADPFSVPFFVSDSANSRTVQPAATLDIDPKVASSNAALRGEGELWDYMRASNELSSDMAAGELEDIILRAASSSAVPNGITLPWSLDAVVPAATAATSAGGNGYSYYTAQASAGSLPQNALQDTAPQNTAAQQFHQEWSNGGGAWTSAGRGEYQLGNGWAPADFPARFSTGASTASTIADTAIHERTDDDFANGGEGMSQFWSQDAGPGTAAAAAAAGHAARHDGGFSPSHLPAILRSLAAHQQAVEALAPLATEPRRQAGEWERRTGEGAVSAAAGWRSSASLPANAAAAAPAPGFLPAEGVFPPLPLTRPAPAASFQRAPASAAALAAAFPASSSSASSAHLAASVAASLAGERLVSVGGGVSFETSQDSQLPQLEARDGSAGHGLAGGGMVWKAGAEATAEPSATGAQNPSAVDALASMILVAAAAAGGQGGGFTPAGPPRAGIGGAAGAGSGGMDGGGRTGGMWGGVGGGMDGGMGGGTVGGVGGEGDEWRSADVAGGVDRNGTGYGDFGERDAYGYGDGNVDAKLQRRNTATSGTGNMGGNMRNMGNIDEKPIAVGQAAGDVGRKRQARGETRKRGRGSERGGRAAGGRQQGANDGAWEDGGAGRRKQQGASDGAWEVQARGGGGGGASAALDGFEEGEGAAEGTRVLGRVSGACLAARKRRERIASQMRTLQRLVPGSSRVDTVSVLSDTIRFLCSLIHQIQVRAGHIHTHRSISPCSSYHNLKLMIRRS
ncbi:unnamed protein product [Closterium sp. Naga37s-1]|nr:unnamed protein product [Closterium sp. Naga37s-1]